MRLRCKLYDDETRKYPNPRSHTTNQTNTTSSILYLTISHLSSLSSIFLLTVYLSRSSLQCRLVSLGNESNTCPDQTSYYQTIIFIQSQHLMNFLGQSQHCFYFECVLEDTHASNPLVSLLTLYSIIFLHSSLSLFQQH